MEGVHLLERSCLGLMTVVSLQLCSVPPVSSSLLLLHFGVFLCAFHASLCLIPFRAHH